VTNGLFAAAAATVTSKIKQQFVGLTEIWLIFYERKILLNI
jgi:hypothetical protein